MAAMIVLLVKVYLAIGLIVALPFVAFGVNRLAPGAARGSWFFRVIIAPGCAVLWPLVLKLWMTGSQEQAQ